MWAALAGAWETLADLAGFPAPPQLPTSDHTVAYLCRACNVHGRGPDDKSLRCWCCDSDDLKLGVSPGVNGHYRSFGPRQDNGEDIESLVG